MTKMLIDRSTVEQALEALAVATSCLDGYYIPRGKTTLPEIEDAITALRAALAEPAQEPDDPARRCGGPGCDGTCCQPVEENKDA